MDLFKKVYYFLSDYANPSERQVGKFFKRTRESDQPYKIEQNLKQLLQLDAAAVNLWSEYKFKGYNYLTKKQRQKLYANLELIRQDFIEFAARNQPNLNVLLAGISRKNIDTAKAKTFPEQLKFLAIIMHYLSPARGLYVYRKSSSFGRLLQNPHKHQLEGDCNQIVTLYIFLYATKFDVSDLKLTLFPGHVALHFFGIDIEATNGQFTKYHKPEQRLAPVSELVSVNLLDTSDSNFAKSAVNPETFLQAARLAYVVSANRALVKKNLEVAYNNAVKHFLDQQNYQVALKYALQSKDYQLIQIAAHNGAVARLKADDFSAARRFAQNLADKTKMQNLIDKNEAAFLFNKQDFLTAAKIYERLGERALAQRCWRALYAREQQNLKGVRTVSDLKNQASTIRNLQNYAQKSGDHNLIKHAQSLARHL